jgi:hypothetical protein
VREKSEKYSKPFAKLFVIFDTQSHEIEKQKVFEGEKLT